MLILYSPAKLNLFLRVTNRRLDGYHNLASLFQTIDLFDCLHFALADRDHLSCTDPTIPTGPSNLIVQAADLFRQRTHLSIGLNVHLEKHIPVEAGLGGGSSNAATTLWALNLLCGRPASVQDLMQWSAEIGSDVPFFLSQGTAYCTGRGEHVRGLAPLPSTQVCVFKPSQGMSTQEVYQSLQISQLKERDPEHFLKLWQQGEQPCFNDLEDVAFALKPELAVVKQRLLSAGFSTAMMTGSGSAFFCLGRGNSISGLQQFQGAFVNREADAWYEG